MKSTSSEVSVLLVEDNPRDAELTQRSLRSKKLANEIVHVTDGQAALDYVRCSGFFASRVRNGPLLILLDLKMPRLDGMETLRQLKADPTTRGIPVIMLTTTDDPREIARCYELGCSVYITKPVEYERFVSAIRQLGLFLQVVRVPAESPGKG